MSDKIKKYKELFDQLCALQDKIRKVKLIIDSQDEDLLFPSVESYRERYLGQLRAQQKQITDQQMEIADQIDLREAFTAMSG